MNTPPTNLHAFRELQLLETISNEGSVTQRALAKTSGLALGLTNLLIRRLVKKGYVKIVNLERKRLRYLLTPQGMAEKLRLSYEYLEYSLYFYRQIRAFLTTVLTPLERSGGQNLLLYGTGEVAEITFLVMKQRGWNVVGVVDGATGGDAFFMNHPVKSLAEISGLVFDRIVVASLKDRRDIVEQLLRQGVPAERIISIPDEEVLDGRTLAADLLRQPLQCEETERLAALPQSNAPQGRPHESE